MKAFTALPSTLAVLAALITSTVGAPQQIPDVPADCSPTGASKTCRLQPANALLERCGEGTPEGAPTYGLCWALKPPAQFNGETCGDCLGGNNNWSPDPEKPQTRAVIDGCLDWAAKCGVSGGLVRRMTQMRELPPPPPKKEQPENPKLKKPRPTAGGF